jgi:hypothetical protein
LASFYPPLEIDITSCPPLEIDITREVLQNPDSNSKPSKLLERTNSMTDLPTVILKSTNLDQVVELTDSQSNPPCSVELSDSKVDPELQRSKR